MIEATFPLGPPLYRTQVAEEHQTGAGAGQSPCESFRFFAEGNGTVAVTAGETDKDDVGCALPQVGQVKPQPRAAAACHGREFAGVEPGTVPAAPPHVARHGNELPRSYRVLAADRCERRLTLSRIQTREQRGHEVAEVRVHP